MMDSLSPNLLLIDKPAGMTSHDVVDRVRRAFKTRKVGHAGTLDPFATGLLIMGIGPGTKELTALVGLDKTYIATARLGATSTTEDPEGEITERASYDVPRTEELERALNKFRGGYEQTASAFSAKKIKGKKLYELARRGQLEGVEIPKKQIEISELKILKYDWPRLSFEVSCSSGTYIRALARDIGEALGCGAYLTELRRTRIGGFDIKDAKILDSLSPER
ncbi:MAG: tRNA pseudouridine(55) synthase TruB [Patescibacteria group bacterium]|nr:tRNA pseudouridine(55) synthase TruB [Patescibacteria group bacterium]